jgi:hypothetical protein
VVVVAAVAGRSDVLTSAPAVAAAAHSGPVGAAAYAV